MAGHKPVREQPSRSTNTPQTAGELEPLPATIEGSDLATHNQNGEIRASENFCGHASLATSCNTRIRQNVKETGWWLRLLQRV